MLDYLSNLAWLNIEPWIDLANRFSEGELEAIAKMPQREAGEYMRSADFGIRGYRYIDDPYLLVKLIRAVKETLRIVATEPRPTGIDFVEPTPSTLLMTALSLIDLRRLKECPVCGKVLYTKRKDQTACQGKCSTTWRQRKFRESSPKYNKNRKRNRLAREAHILRGLKRPKK